MAAIERIAVVDAHETVQAHEPKLEVAMQMHDILRSYGHASEEQCGREMLAVRRAGPYMYGLDETGRRHVFRLIAPVSWPLSHEVLAADAEVRSFKVIRLEHGWLEVELDEGVIEEEEFHWGPYAAAIIDRSNLDDPEFYNTQNGDELDLEDLLNLQVILSSMAEAYKRELYQAALESITAEAAECEWVEVPVEELRDEDRTVLAPFEFKTLDSCLPCDRANIFCEHRPGILN